MEIKSHHRVTFREFGGEIDAIIVGGERYFTLKDIGKWLGYTNPKNAIHRIVSRHPNINQHSKTIKVRVQEKYKKTQYKRQMTRVIRVFSVAGLMLIAMKATSKVSNDRNIAIAKVMAHLFLCEEESNNIENKICKPIPWWKRIINKVLKALGIRIKEHAQVKEELSNKAG